MWLSIFRYIQITTVSTVFRRFKMFQHFWVARDLFALPLPLALLCLFSADYSHLHPQQGPPPSHLQPPGESPAITVRGWPSYPLNPTARPSIDLSLWCHTGTHNNEGPQTFWRYPACSWCFSRNQQHAAHLVRAMRPLPFLLFLFVANIFAYSFDVSRQVLHIFISVYIPAYMNCKSGRHGTRLSLTQLRGPTHFWPCVARLGLLMESAISAKAQWAKKFLGTSLRSSVVYRAL